MHDRLAGVPPSGRCWTSWRRTSPPAMPRARHYSPWTTRLLQRHAEELRGAVDQPRPDRVRAAERLHRDRHRHGPRRRAVQPRAVRPTSSTSADGSLGLPAYSSSNNDHYEALEAQGVDLKDRPQAVAAVGGDRPAARRRRASLTTRAAAEAFFIAGTNRAMFRFTMLNHMCRDMEQVHDTSRPPDRIRQDVSRAARAATAACSSTTASAATAAWTRWRRPSPTTTSTTETSARLVSTRRASCSRSTSTTTRLPVWLHHAGRPLGQPLAQGAANALLGWDAALPGIGQRRQVAGTGAGATAMRSPGARWRRCSRRSASARPGNAADRGQGRRHGR